MQALVSADRATSQRAERLLPLLLPVVRGLGDVSDRHTTTAHSGRWC